MRNMFTLVSIVVIANIVTLNNASGDSFRNGDPRAWGIVPQAVTLPPEYLFGDSLNARSGPIRARILGTRKLANGKTIVSVGFVADLDGSVFLYSPSSSGVDSETKCRRDAIFVDSNGNEYISNRCLPIVSVYSAIPVSGAYQIGKGEVSVHTFEFSTPPSDGGRTVTDFTLSVSTSYQICTEYTCSIHSATLAFYR
jgi:hypothetical protein